MLLQCKSQFVYALEKFSGKKSLSNFITKKEKFIEPVELNIGYDSIDNKPDTIQYVPVLSTLTRVLKHEDVLGEVFASKQPNI